MIPNRSKVVIEPKSAPAKRDSSECRSIDGRSTRWSSQLLLCSVSENAQMSTLAKQLGAPYPSHFHCVTSFIDSPYDYLIFCSQKIYLMPVHKHNTIKFTHTG